MCLVVGVLNAYACEGCGYTAEVSGGPDYGGISHTQTMACRNCQELVDVVIATEEEARARAVVGRCPRCGRAARLVAWGKDAGGPGAYEPRSLEQMLMGVSRSRLDADPHPVWGPCPKCGGDMVFTDSVGMWDG